jgi:hypothetical protein
MRSQRLPDGQNPQLAGGSAHGLARGDARTFMLRGHGLSDFLFAPSIARGFFGEYILALEVDVLIMRIMLTEKVLLFKSASS